MTANQTLYTLLRLSRLITAIRKHRTTQYAKRVAKSYVVAKATGKWRSR